MMYAYLSKYYDAIFDFNPKLSGFISLFIKPNGLAIDLGCGTGRLTNLLNEQKMNVIGIDLDEYMIEMARHKYPHLSFKVEDMIQSFDSDVCYDLMTCFGNTIVHLNLNQVYDLFKKMKNHLKKEGHIILQTLNYDHILKSKPPHLKNIEKDGLKFYRSYTYQKDLIVFKTELHVENQCFEGSTVIYPHLLHDFMLLAKAYDMSLTIYGDMIEHQVNEKTNHIYYVFKN